MADDFSLSTIAARLAGHAWDAIHDYVDGGQQAALEGGYSPEDIDQYLGRNSPNGLMDRLGAAWRVQKADDPSISKALDDTQPGPIAPLDELPASRIAGHADVDEIPPVEMPQKPDASPPPLDFDTPAMRDHYAEALNEGSVRSPQDFAERYAGTYWNAVGGDAGHGAAVVRSASALAQTLPTDDEFTDAAIAVAGRAGIEMTPGAVGQVKDRLTKEWASTGAPPQELVQQAHQDPQFVQDMTEPPKPPTNAPWWAADPETTASVEASKDIEPWLLDHFGSLVKDWGDWGEAQKAIADRLRGKSFNEKALDPEGLETALSVAFGAMVNPIEKIGPALADVIEKMGMPKARVLTPEGEVIQQPIDQAVRPPEPAPPAEPAEGAEPQPGTFAPEAQPAEKLAALARDAGDRSVPFEELARGQDPATRELARANDAGGALRKFFFETMPKTISDLMEDESGALRLRTPQAAQQATDRAEGRDYARELIIRNMVGNAQRDITHYTDLLEPHYRPVVKDLGEWEAELAKGPAGQPMTTPIGVAIDYMEGRSAGAYIDPNSPLKAFADTVRDVNQALDKRLRQQAQEGLIRYDGYIQDYYAHQWTDPASVRADAGTGKLGTSASLQERTTFPTLADGIRAGYEPRFTNPIEATAHDIQGKLLYSHAADMIDEAEQAGHIYWAREPASSTDMRINGGIGTRARVFPDPNNPGQTILQDVYAYANEGFARNMNDWLSRGLYDRPSTASFLDNLMYMKNATTAFKLALPLFHSITVSIGSLASGVGQGLEEIGRGQLFRAMGNLGKVATVAPNLLENSIVGLRAIRRYTDLANDPAIDALTKAGMTFTKPIAPEAGYSFGTNSIYTSLRRGTLGREIGQSILSIGGDPKTEEPLARVLKAVLWRGPVAFPLREAGRLMSLVTAPVFDTLIPALKVGSSYRRMQSFLAANPTAAPDVVARYARQVATDVDNRLGELNLDTVFWPKAAKQAINAATISTSWAYGTYRGLMAAVGYNAERAAFEWNPAATTSLIGTATVYAYANALMQYLHTGQTPLDSDTPIKDFLNFRTGGTTKTGAPERGMVPSELKELYDLGKVAMRAIATGQPSDAGPAMMEYALAKANPFMQIVEALLTGKDGVGHDIATMPGGWTRFFTENQMPIFLQQLENRRKGTQLNETENVAGIREASKFVTDPPAYFEDLQRVRDRNAKQEASRYRKEMAQREDPEPSWGDPAPPAASSRGGSRQQQFVDPATGVTHEVLDPSTGTMPERNSRGARTQGGGGGARGSRGNRGVRSSGGRGHGGAHSRGGRGGARGGGGRMVASGSQSIGGGAQGV